MISQFIFDSGWRAYETGIVKVVDWADDDLFEYHDRFYFYRNINDLQAHGNKFLMILLKYGYNLTNLDPIEFNFFRE